MPLSRTTRRAASRSRSTSGTLFTYVAPEQRVPADHPLRAIRRDPLLGGHVAEHRIRTSIVSRMRPSWLFLRVACAADRFRIFSILLGGVPRLDGPPPRTIAGQIRGAEPHERERTEEQGDRDVAEGYAPPQTLAPPRRSSAAPSASGPRKPPAYPRVEWTASVAPRWPGSRYRRSRPSKTTIRPDQHRVQQHERGRARVRQRRAEADHRGQRAPS